MKISERKLRLIIKEELLKQKILKEADKSLTPKQKRELMTDFDNLNNIGDLKKFINRMNSLIKAGIGGAALKQAGIDLVADYLLPGSGTAISLAQTLKKIYSLPDDKKINSNLDILNVDDDVSKIVDDTIEDNFLNVAIKRITDSSADSDPIPDMTKSLQSFIKNKYNSRTIDGF